VVDITPSRQLHLAGIDPERISTGVESKLEANILLCVDSTKTLILLGLDTLFSSEVFEYSLRRKIEFIDSEVVISTVATHTHYAPSLDPTKPMLGEFDQLYFDEIVNRIATAILEVYEKVKDVVAIKAGSRICRQNIYRRKFAFSRRAKSMYYRKVVKVLPNPKVPVFSEFQIYEFYSESTLEFVFWSWPCHAINMSNPNVVSSDFVGVVRDSIRQKYGISNLAVVYFPGFAGDLKAKVTKFNCSAMGRLNTPFINFKFDQSPVKYRYFCNSLIEALNKIEVRMVDMADNDGLAFLAVDLPSDKIGTTAKGFEFKMQKLHLGPIKLYLIGAEVCSAYYSILDTYSSSNTLFSGYAGQVFGYLASDKQIKEGGYEVDGYLVPFGLKGKMCLKIQDYVLRQLSKLD